MNPEKMCKRVDAGVSLLVWLCVFALACIVLLFDVLVWRPN